MIRPKPLPITVTYGLHSAIKYLAHKKHGEYFSLLETAIEIKNACGRDSILSVDPEECVNETYFDGPELNLMRALVKEFKLTELTHFSEYE